MIIKHGYLEKMRLHYSSPSEGVFQFYWEIFIESLTADNECICCEMPGKIRRQNTGYNKDEKNFECLCERCQIERDSYWAERWNEYNGSRM